MPPQVRPTIARLHLEALQHNARIAARRLGGAELLAVVKADAYGHGAVAVSRALEAVANEAGVRWLGVALVEEGVSLREAGVRLPILVLGGAYEGGYEALVAHDLTPVVFAPRHLAGVARAGGGAVHLKVDTGMGRLGVLPGELEALLAAASDFPGVRIEGVLSHLANADIAGDPETPAQAERFAAAVSAVRAAGHTPRWIHLANSAAVLDRLPGEETLARPGLMLYGYAPAPHLEEPELRAVLTWSTAVVHLKAVPAGFKVSYGHAWTASRPSVLATLPVGYADGYRRGLGSPEGGGPGAPVLVRGRRAPVVGRVCMDLCVVDVTDVPGVSVGDEVVLLGAQGNERIGADELASRLGTIAYEVLCGIGARVPRVTT